MFRRYAGSAATREERAGWLPHERKRPLAAYSPVIKTVSYTTSMLGEMTAGERESYCRMANSVALFIPIFIAAVAVIVDLATGRGYGLTVLVVVVLGVTVVALWSAQMVDQQEADEVARQGSSFRVGWGAAIGIVILLAGMCYAQIVAGLAALAVAALTRHWRWLIGIAVGLLVLALVDWQAWGPDSRRALGPLLLSLLTGVGLLPSLIYGMWRIAHRAQGLPLPAQP